MIKSLKDFALRFYSQASSSTKLKNIGDELWVWLCKKDSQKSNK